MIKYLLFDADDTLFDFKKCELSAFERTCNQYGLDNSAIYADYTEINNELWGKFNLNQIAKEILVIERFKRLFTLHKITADPGVFNTDYLRNLGDESYLFDGAVDLCRDLYNSGKYEMYIITNGVESTQLARFYGSLLSEFFKDIYISEKIGYQKPLKEYFEYVINQSGITRDEAFIIGDSLSSDIKGGNNADIITCWYNPEHKNYNPNEYKCDYIIHNLNELRGILEI